MEAGLKRLLLSTRITFSVAAYCCALDVHGSHCVVGGQDRHVALYVCGTSREVWTTNSPDATRIYAVALSRDMQVRSRSRRRPSCSSLALSDLQTSRLT